MKYTKLDNTHAHLLKVRYKEQVDSLLESTSENADFCSATTWGSSVLDCLMPEDLEGISMYHYGKFEVGHLGHNTYAIRKRGSTTIDLILYCSQEIRTEQGLHITAECCDKQIEEGQDARKTVEQIHKYSGKAILEHPFTINDPIIKYRLLIHGPDRKRIELIKELLPIVDGVEVFNGMNTLYMFVSNLLAKDLIHSFERRNSIYVPKLAGGDEHYNPLGRTGNLLPLEDLTQATGREIQQWRWEQYKKGNFKRKENLTRPSTFIKYIGIPFIYWKKIL